MHMSPGWQDPLPAWFFELPTTTTRCRAFNSNPFAIRRVEACVQRSIIRCHAAGGGCWFSQQLWDAKLGLTGDPRPPSGRCCLSSPKWVNDGCLVPVLAQSVAACMWLCLFRCVPDHTTAGGSRAPPSEYIASSCPPHPPTHFSAANTSTSRTQTLPTHRCQWSQTTSRRRNQGVPLGRPKITGRYVLLKHNCSRSDQLVA